MGTETSTLPSALTERIAARAEVLKNEQQKRLWQQTDRMFACLLVLQWIAGIIVAAWLSPRAWSGLESYVHPHIWAAVWLGGVVAIFPILLVAIRPGEAITRMTIAAAQMCHSAMLIHLSGGRIETHFHVFGSLAFLSFYRDWRVLVPATIVVALDHALRGIFWPASAFGIIETSPWRWVEHAGWVVFEDIILVWSCVRGAKELGVLALRQAELETTNERVEAEVARKTERLESVTQELMATARRAGMAEIATGVLHNVGNALNSVNVSSSVVAQKLRGSEIATLVQAGDLLRANKANMADFLTRDERGKLLPQFLTDLAEVLGKEQAELVSEMDRVASGLDHIKQIVSAQQKHAKGNVVRDMVSPAQLAEQAISMDQSESDVRIVREFEAKEPAALDKHKVLQILLNLITNAKKALETSGVAEKRIVVSTQLIETGAEKRVLFQVRDNGAGIAQENLARIFSHGFTTHQEGHGFGLHSSANAAREMGGDLTAQSDGEGRGATFTLSLPLAELSETEKLMTNRKGTVTQCSPA